MDNQTEPTWDKNLETGDSDIDNHHKELFHLVTMLDGAIDQDSTAKIEKILQFLETYTHDHFAEEEALMQRHNYPGLAHHQKEHQIFVARVEEIRQDFDSKKSNAKIIYGIRRFIDQLVAHIITVDIGLKSLTK